MKTRQLSGVWSAVIAILLTVLPIGENLQAAPGADVKRTVEAYTVPDVTLLNQDGKKIKLKSILNPGKPVIIDFIYTTCTTICPVLSANFLNIQNKLDAASDTVQLVSISIDPEYDRPEQMHKYLKMFRAREGWDFLTGSREDIIRVLEAFDATVVDKMSHIPLYVLRGPKSEDWIRIHGLIGAADLMNELGRIR